MTHCNLTYTLLNTFTNVWFNETVLVQGFKFYDGYTLPECKTIEEYNEFINNLPTQDIPEVFGLHANSNSNRTCQIFENITYSTSPII